MWSPKKSPAQDGPGGAGSRYWFSFENQLGS